MAKAFDILKYYLYYKYRLRERSREALEKRQERRLKRHLAYVAGHSPVYRGLKRLEDYPKIDKSFMTEHFSELNTAGISRKEAEQFAVQAERNREFSPKLRGVTVGLSSGTSGQRGIFLVSEKETARWAGYVLAKFLPGSILGRHSIAFFMRADSNLYQAVNTGRIRLCFFDISKDMGVHMEKLQALCPKILVGQPSVLLMLAGEKKAGRLTLLPNMVISIAEVLEKEDESRLKEAFGLPVIHQVYQCTEGFLASTCRFGTLHINEDIVQIEREYLDEKRFVPVVTDFERRLQPIIRYRLNDILVEKTGGCACKSPHLALEKIEGREDDVFCFPGPTGEERTVFPDFIRRCLLFAEGEVPIWKAEPGDYRIVQREDRTLTVYADLTKAGEKRVEEELLRLSAELGFVLPPVDFMPYSREPGRKLKRVERIRRKGI